MELVIHVVSVFLQRSVMECSPLWPHYLSLTSREYFSVINYVHVRYSTFKSYTPYIIFLDYIPPI